MRLFALLSAASIVASAAVPAASAKIFPYDFGADAMDVYMNLEQPITFPGSADMDHDSLLAPLANPTEDDNLFFGEEMPVSDVSKDGSLTRAQFAEAIATRLYSADAHLTCFEELAGTMNFELLFKDVPVDASYATSVCLMMHNGLMKGSSDMLFHPNARVTAAEAATVFSRLALLPRAEKAKEAWYERYMEAMRSIDPEFTLRAWETYDVKNLRHSMCIFGEFLPAIDPAAEFVGEC